MDNKRFLILDFDIFVDELYNHFKNAKFQDSDKSIPVCILTEKDISELICKSYVKDATVIGHSKSRKDTNEKSENIDAMIDSHRWRRYYI